MIVLKIFLFILLGILAITLLLLLLPVTADVSFIGGNFKYRVKYAFAAVLDSEKESSSGKSKKSKSQKKKKKPESGGSHNENNDKPREKKAENASEDKPPETAESSEIKDKKPKGKSAGESGKKRGKTLGEKVEFVLKLLEIANRPVRHLLKRIRIADLYVDFLAADEDACKCAVRYGEVSGIVYNLIAVLEEFFTVSYKTIDIECGYNQKDSRWDFSFRLRIVPMTVVISAVWLIIGYFFKIYMSQKRKTGKSKKTAGAQPLGSN